jgi:uncharacterized repeat protein (TIGR03847 family)
MRSLGLISHFAAGAVGPPGRRLFLIEIDPGTGLEWYAAEKEQVGVLAATALELLEALDAPATGPGPDIGVPDTPVFRIGRIALGIEHERAHIELHPVEAVEGDPVSFEVTLDVLEGMARRAAGVVASGRPPCAMCGLPEDPDNHACPSSNGDLRAGS